MILMLFLPLYASLPSARAVTRNGLTAAQWGSLWSTRAILILSALIGAYGMYVCGVVMQEQGNRSLLQSGMRAFLAAGTCVCVCCVRASPLA